MDPLFKIGLLMFITGGIGTAFSLLPKTLLSFLPIKILEKIIESWENLSVILVLLGIILLYIATFIFILHS